MLHRDQSRLRKARADVSVLIVINLYLDNLLEGGFREHIFPKACSSIKITEAIVIDHYQQFDQSPIL